MRKLYVYFFFFTSLLCSSAWAQNGTLTGIVKDSTTGEPLVGCSVYIDGTSLGTFTNAEGYYSLANISLDKFDLIFSYMGYITERKPVSFAESRKLELNVKLKQKDSELTMVSISGKRDSKWKKLLKEFQISFFGPSAWASSCEIENPYILDLKKSKGVLTASTDGELIVKNHALGYILKFQNLAFSSDFESYTFRSNTFFTEMETNNPDSLLLWNSNRIEAYRKSPIFFYKSAVDNKLEENGFKLYVDRNPATPTRDVDFKVSLKEHMKPWESLNVTNYIEFPGAKLIRLPSNLEVHNTHFRGNTRLYRDFEHSISWINCTGGLAAVSESGIPLYPSLVTASGDLQYYRVSGLLPLDFVTESIRDSLYYAEIDRRLDDQSFLAENVVIHINKPAYYQGENIWFKTFQVYPTKVEEEVKSQVVYVELFSNRDKVIVDTVVVRSLNGDGFGQFSLAKNIEPGIYGIRAYTNWMRNFGDSTIAITPILVLENGQVLPKQDNLEADDEWINLENGVSERGLSFRINAEPFNSYTVSVLNETNNSYVLPIIKPILSNKPITDSLIKYNKEKQGRSFIGNTYDKPFSDINFVPSGGGIFSNPLTSDANSFFLLQGVRQQDTIRVHVLAMDEKGRNLKNLSLKEFPRPVIPVIRYQYEQNKVIASEKSMDLSDVPKDAIELDAVDIVGKRTVSPILRKERAMLGGAPLTYTSEDFKKSGSPNLLHVITSTVPGIRLNLDPVTGDLDLYWASVAKRTMGFVDIRSGQEGGGGALGGGGSSRVSILVDGVRVHKTDDLRSYQIEEISTIDLYKDPVIALGLPGVICIYTKNYLMEKREASPFSKTKALKSFVFQGFLTPEVFKNPEEGSSERTVYNKETIYWNPNLSTDHSGQSEVSFPYKFPTGNYRIEVVGYSESGEIKKSFKRFTVN